MDKEFVPKKKRKLKKKVYVLFVIILLLFGGVGYYFIKENNLQNKREEEERILTNIKSHYNEFVKVNKDSKLYIKNNNDYQEVGTIYENEELNLDNIEINIDTKYFPIKGKDYYIEYENLSKVEELVKYSDRYKNYIPFNENIITNNEFTLYDNDKKVITLKESKEFPIIIKNYDDKYYIEYDNRLLSIKKEEVKETIKHENTKKKNQSKITTLAYHRIYDTNDKCKDGYICLKKSNFDKQMKYLSDNNYFTLNMKEMYMYLKGNLQIEKGITITFDDGYLYKAADEVLTKYNFVGTMFVITGDFSDFEDFKKLKSINLESHSNIMHQNYKCQGGSQGGLILCYGYENIKKDLLKSCEKLEIEPFAFAFPFYDFNDTAIKALKDSGFKISFIGRSSTMGKSTPKVTDTYKVPRMTVWEENLMSFNKWKSYL